MQIWILHCTHFVYTNIELKNKFRALNRNLICYVYGYMLPNIFKIIFLPKIFLEVFQFFKMMHGNMIGRNFIIRMQPMCREQNNRREKARNKNENTPNEIISYLKEMFYFIRVSYINVLLLTFIIYYILFVVDDTKKEYIILF